MFIKGTHSKVILCSVYHNTIELKACFLLLVLKSRMVQLLLLIIALLVPTIAAPKEEIEDENDLHNQCGM